MKFTKDQYIALLEKNLTTWAIADELKTNQTAVCIELKAYGLLPNSKKAIRMRNNVSDINNGNKVCSHCNEKKPLSEYFKYKHGKIHTYCKSCNAKRSLDRIHIVKLQAIKYKGGKCVKCGYSKNPSALHFHHINDDEKSFEISDFKTTNINALKPELDKCVLVCANCHAEEHHPDLNFTILID